MPSPAPVAPAAPGGGLRHQGRFSSVTLDDAHLTLATRTMALDPVRARLVQRPQDWAWSSLSAHLEGRDDSLVTVAPLLERLGSMTRLVDTGRRRSRWRAYAPPN